MSKGLKTIKKMSTVETVSSDDDIPWVSYEAETRGVRKKKRTSLWTRKLSVY